MKDIMDYGNIIDEFIIGISVAVSVMGIAFMFILR